MFENQLKTFFFKAMLAGWIQGCEKQPVPGMPGYKMISYKENDLMLVDCYCTNPKTRSSSGTTTIFMEDQPVWWMSYYGEYQKEAIPFLHEALQRAYQEKTFFGGRGPVGFQHHGLRYSNAIDRNMFNDFAGTEKIHDVQDNLLGWHRYHGFSLI